MEYIDNKDLLYILFNLITMMEDRGYYYLLTNYDIIKKEKELIDIDIDNEISDYTYLIKDKVNILFKKCNKYIICLFSESFYKYDPNITYICKNIITFLSNNDIWSYVTKSIIICPNDIEDKINKKLKEEVDIIETISYSRLLYNPTKHIDSVKHEKIKNFEKKHKKYDLKLPILLKSDAMSKWYDYSVNDIIKITRNEGSITHRIVKIDKE